MALLDRRTSGGPKRILALDGGGIRGALTVGYLESVESLLRQRHQRPDLRLCDYFDLIEREWNRQGSQGVFGEECSRC